MLSSRPGMPGSILLEVMIAFGGGFGTRDSSQSNQGAARLGHYDDWRPSDPPSVSRRNPTSTRRSSMRLLSSAIALSRTISLNQGTGTSNPRMRQIIPQLGHASSIYRPWLGIPPPLPTKGGARTQDGGSTPPNRIWKAFAESGQPEPAFLGCGTTIPRIGTLPGGPLSPCGVPFGMRKHRRLMEPWSKPRAPDFCHPHMLPSPHCQPFPTMAPSMKLRGFFSCGTGNVAVATLDSAGPIPPTKAMYGVVQINAGDPQTRNLGGCHSLLQPFVL